MKKISNLIKYVDIFGHGVNLNYNKKGSTVNTVLGGFLSLALGISCFYLFYQAFGDMLQHKDPQLNSFSNDADLNEIGDVPFDKTNILIYYKVIQVSQNFAPMDYSQVVRYLNIYY